jgi:hypothetical protein
MRIRYAARTGEGQGEYESPDEPATEALPGRTDESTYEIDRAAVVSEKEDQLTLRGGARPERLVPRAVDGGRAGLDELAEYADGPDTPAFRPPWLALEHLPRIRPALIPRLVGAAATHVTTIGESTTAAWPWTTPGKLFMDRPGQSGSAAGCWSGRACCSPRATRCRGGPRTRPSGSCRPTATATTPASATPTC